MIGEAPFRNWSLYFDSSDYSNGNATSRVIYRCIEVLRSGELAIDKEGAREGGHVSLDLSTLRRLIGSDVEEMLEEVPEKLFGALGLAICEVVHEHCWTAKAIHARLVPLTSDLPVQFKALKAAIIGKAVKVNGTVVRASSIRPKLKQVSFICLACQQSNTHKMYDGIFKNPTKCPTVGCASKQFQPQREAAETICSNWQRLKIQESFDDEEMECDLAGTGGEGGRVPRTVEVEMEHDLVDSVAPGDRVTLFGVVKALDVNEGKAKTSPSFSVYIEANWIRREKDEMAAQVSELEVIRLLEVVPQKDILPLLIASFCPSIYGQSLVKFGILLTLFGGSSHMDGPRAKRSFSIRSDSHLLLVGDPGLGKSQLITAASAIAPRGLYVCGNTCTSAGLTATLHHEGSSGEYGLEAGAMVLGDRGVCCIDEFDKISDPRVLLDVMEQQQVNVAKAGVVCSLPARTSVLAAANPVGGHYNKSKGLLANLKIDPALLSRFDLVFVLLDCPDAELDRMLSDQVLGTFTRNKIGNIKQFQKATLKNDPDDDDDDNNMEVKPPSLLQRITKSIAGHERLTHSQLRKLIGYARSKVNPKLTPEAGARLQQFYLELRRSHRDQLDDILPVTTRHLESLIRLCEARAKMELRPVANESDATDVIELMRHCMYDFLHASDGKDSGKSDLAGKRNKGAGRSALIKRFISELIQISSSTGESLFSEKQLRDLHGTLQMTMNYPFSDFLDALNQNGYLLKRGQGQFKLVVT